MSDKEINFVTHTCKHCGKAFIEQDNNNSQDVPPTWRYCPECVKNGYRNRVMTKNERHLVKLYDFYKENNIKDSKIQDTIEKCYFMYINNSQHVRLSTVYNKVKRGIIS